MPCKDVEVDIVLGMEVGVNYLAVAARQSASIIKVSGQKHSNEFKRRLFFSFTVIILT